MMTVQKIILTALLGFFSTGAFFACTDFLELNKKSGPNPALAALALLAGGGGPGPGPGPGPGSQGGLSWSAAADITAPGSGSVLYYAADMNEKGDIVVAYLALHNSGSPFTGQIQNLLLYASVRVNGVWSHPTNERDIIMACGDSPAFCGSIPLKALVHMDENGKASVVFAQQEGLTFRLFRSVFNAGTWTRPTAAADSFTFAGVNVNDWDLAAARNGDAVVLWDTSVNSYISRYVNGVWSDPLDSTVTENNLIVSPSPIYKYVLLNDGTLIQAGISGTLDSGVIRTYANVFSASVAAPSVETPVITGYYFLSGTPAANNAGNGFVLWQVTDNLISGPYRATMSLHNAGFWTHPDAANPNLSGVLHTGAGYAEAALMNEAGVGIAASTLQTSPLEHGVFVTENFGGTMRLPAGVEENHHYLLADGYSDVGLDLDSTGNALVAWVYSDGAGAYQAFRAEYRGGAWSDPASSAHGFGQGADSGKVRAFLADDTGHGFIIWQRMLSNGTMILKYSEHNP